MTSRKSLKAPMGPNLLLALKGRAEGFSDPILNELLKGQMRFYRTGLKSIVLPDTGCLAFDVLQVECPPIHTLRIMPLTLEDSRVVGNSP